MLREGDILKKGSKFYRVYDFARKSNDVVCNQILYNPNKESLVISQYLTWISLDDIDKHVYEKVPTEKSKQLLEIVKRKYKLLKINGLFK